MFMTFKSLYRECWVSVLGFNLEKQRLGNNAKGKYIGTRTCVTISGPNVGHTGRGLNLQVTLVSGP